MVKNNFKYLIYSKLPFIDKFWIRVEKTDTCWNWLGSKCKDGYGQVSCDGVLKLVHRVSYELANGKIPNNLLVLHTCDNPACVNPKHLFLGTNQDNADDKVKKGRQSRIAPIKGDNHPHSKLTSKIVKLIRKRYKRESYNKSNVRELAKQYGVGIGAIHKVIAGLRWKNND